MVIIVFCKSQSVIERQQQKEPLPPDVTSSFALVFLRVMGENSPVSPSSSRIWCHRLGANELFEKQQASQASLHAVTYLYHRKELTVMGWVFCIHSLPTSHPTPNLWGGGRCGGRQYVW